MKKISKQILSVIIMAVLIITAAPISVNAVTGDDALSYLTYEIKNGEVTITDCDRSVSGEFVIPATIEGYPVTVIGENAFRFCWKLTNVIIPETVIDIESGAFDGCEKFNSIVIPDSVKSIGDSAFSSCYNVTNLVIGNGVESIGERAFNGLKASEIYIPSSVKIIGYDAFYSSSRLNKIVVSEYNSVYDSRSNCNAIIETATNTLIRGCKNTIIPNNITAIGDYALCGSELTSLILPNCLNSIGRRAFGDCQELTYVEIPDNVTSIGDAAFQCCTKLANVILPKNLTYIGESTFYNCENLINVEIPDEVTTIGQEAFSYCTSLVSLTLPNKLSRIGTAAFLSCFKLSNITIPNSVKHIAWDAFANCQSLTNVIIPDNVEKVDRSAFENCTELTSVTIGRGLIDLSGGVFSGCTKLEKIIVSKDNKKYKNIEGSNAIVEVNTNTLVVGYERTTIPDSVTAIGKYAFYNSRGLTRITIPESVTSINDGAFSACVELTSITIPESVINIGTDAFLMCENVKKVTIPKSVTNIGEYALGYTLDGGGFYEKLTDFKIYCYENTAGEEYAINNYFDYEIIDASCQHKLEHVIIPSTCTVIGIEYDICTECGVTFNEKTLALADHTWDDYNIIEEPTKEADGKGERVCSVCGVKDEIGFKFKEDNSTGVQLMFPYESEDETIKVKDETKTIGNIIKYIKIRKIYNITMLKDGEPIQPKGSVEVRIPIPKGFDRNKVRVYHIVNNETMERVELDKHIVGNDIEGYYVVFTTDHFSYFAIGEEVGKVNSVSVSDITLNYKASTTLKPTIKADSGVTYKIEYSSSNTKVATVDKNGKVYAAKKGSATITCTVTDSLGNVVTDTCKVTVKYSFGQWLIKILLFGWIWY